MESYSIFSFVYGSLVEPSVFEFHPWCYISLSFILFLQCSSSPLYVLILSVMSDSL